MMNQMQQPKMGGVPELTEEELKKLALLLQQMPANEGIMTGTPTEMGQMEEQIGPGNPLPGTQGLGPAGGPVKSYAKGKEDEDGRIDEDHRIAVLTDAEVAALNYMKHQDKAQGFQSGNGPMIQALAQMNTDELEFYKYKGMQLPSLNGLGAGDADDTGSGGSNGDEDRSGNVGDTSNQTGTEIDNATYDFDTPDQPGTSDPDPDPDPDPGPDDNNNQETYVPPPPKYYDMNGKEFSTPEAAAASDLAITTAMTAIEGEILTTDSTFELWLANNKDVEAYAGLTDAQMQTAYTTALTKSQSAASTQVPKMVEAMNGFFNTTTTDATTGKVTNTYNENTTYEEFVAVMGANMPANLSEATMRDMYENARKKFQRGEAFTLTPEEVAEFSREAIKSASVADAVTTTVGSVADATTTAVASVTDVPATTVAAIASVTDADIDAIFAGGTDKAEALLLARVNGTANSPAEQQLFRTSEQNMRMLLGATAGGNSDPAKMRQLKNIWADMTQIAVGDAADLRSKESLAAEAQLVELYRGKDTAKLDIRLANMEKDKQAAFKNGDYELAGKLSNQQTSLQRVITQATLDTNIKIANLEKAKQLAIEQGKMDLATSIANLQKNLTIATVDAKLAVQQRALDDGLAMAAYQGQQELYGLETEIDIETMKSDLTIMGFDLSRDLAEMDNATRIEVARLTGLYNTEAAKTNRDQAKMDGYITLIGTAIAAYGVYAASDIRMKTNIADGSDEVESFLDALNSYSYEYKDENAPGADAGAFVGVMAQDLEKTAMGSSFVKDTPEGKMVDYGHGLAAILASQANIHDRLRNLEEG